MMSRLKLFHIVMLLMFFLGMLNLSCKSPVPKETEILPDTLKYVLKIEVDFEQEKIFSECALTVKNPSGEPIDTVPLILYRLLDVTSVTDKQGKDLPYSQNVVKYTDWEQLQVNSIRVRLSPRLASGETQTLVIRYQGPLLGYSEVMRYVKDHIDKEYTVLREDCRTYPEVGIPSWKANRGKVLQSFDYKASITVPDPLIVANGGELTEKTESDGKITYTYQSLVPSWRMDFTIADYEILEDKTEKIRIFCFPQDKTGALNLLGNLLKTMELYTGWFGPLKVFGGLTVIEIPEGYGSQADVATILQEESAFKSPDSHYGFYHELSHLWNVKSRDELPPRFESEGLAMFLQHLVQEKLEAKPDAVKTAVNAMRDRLRKNFTQHPEWTDVPMIDYGNEDITDLSYRKGQIFFYILYELMGEEQFLETMGSFYQKYFDTGATALEFVDHVKNGSSMNFDVLFEEWIYGAKSSELIMSDSSITEIIERYKQ
jgi:hypothetical protein